VKVWIYRGEILDPKAAMARGTGSDPINEPKAQERERRPRTRREREGGRDGRDGGRGDGGDRRPRGGDSQ
jgi:ribosomal protein S3